MHNTKKHRLGIVDFALVDLGLNHLEALIYQYVARFEKNKKPCFASIPHIAKELRLSEPSTKRYIQKLIKLGFLKQTDRGRGRVLTTNGIKTIPINGIKLIGNGIKLIRDRDQIDPGEWDQIDPLPIKDLPIEDLPIEQYQTAARPKPLQNNSQISDQSGFVMQWDESRRVMVRRKVD
jgi:predicted DNA-binding transcriptional regulator